MDGFISSRANVTTNEKPGRRVLLVPKDQEIRRKRKTIQRGKPERLPWPDESARALAASKFVGGPGLSWGKTPHKAFLDFDKSQIVPVRELS